VQEFIVLFTSNDISNRFGTSVDDVFLIKKQTQISINFLTTGMDKNCTHAHTNPAEIADIIIHLFGTMINFEQILKLNASIWGYIDRFHGTDTVV